MAVNSPWARGGRIQIGGMFTRADADRIEAFAIVENRSKSSALVMLAVEALDARGFSAQPGQDGPEPAGQGHDTGHVADEALSAAQPVGGR